SPGSWTADEKRLTDASFNTENASPTSRGYFLGDYEGLSAAGSSFYALFAQAGPGPSDPSNIWFRDPPPPAETPTPRAAAAAVTPSGMRSAPGVITADALAGLGIGALAGNTPGPGGAGTPHTGGRPSAVARPPSTGNNSGPLMMLAAQSADIRRFDGV